MRLGDLIDTLSNFHDATPIRYEGAIGRPVGPLMSWRGRYNELTLTPANEGDSDIRSTVGEVLADAKAAVGATFTGYKGGEYVMDRDTPVWADDYGDCDYWMVSGVALINDVVVLTRFSGEDYQGW